MASTDIEFKGSKQKRGGIKGQLDSTKEYCWNPQTKQFMGRTGASWGKIGLFYLVFYSCLAGFFAIMLSVFFQTMGDREPSQSGMSSLIKGNPGMGFRPMIDQDTNLISFEQGKNSTYLAYVNQIEAFFNSWKDAAAKGNATDCEGRDPADIDDWDEDNDYCAFDISQLEQSVCTRDQDYGYYEGTPCVLIKMNKVYNWKPLPYSNSSEEIPEEAGGDLDGKHIKITCGGENDPDNDYLGDVEFFPPGGIAAKYFPFKKQPGYQSPMVFARFKNPRYGMLMQVWCKAWAENIMHHKNDKAGSVHFELLID